MGPAAVTIFGKKTTKMNITTIKTNAAAPTLITVVDFSSNGASVVAPSVLVIVDSYILLLDKISVVVNGSSVDVCSTVVKDSSVVVS